MRARNLFSKFTAVLVILFAALMPQAAFATGPTLVAATIVKQNNYAVIAGDLNLAPVAMDAVNGNYFNASGKEILMFLNTDTSTHTVTVSSTADSLGRLDTSLTTYTVPVAAGGLSGISVVDMTNLTGWVQSGQTVNLTTSSALVKIVVLRHQ